MTGPKLSVVIPVYRDWDRLQTLLGALNQQSLPADRIEVIVVANDAGPPDPLPFGILLHCATPGSYAARNIGWRAATAPRIVFTDADCLPDAAWLAAIAEAAQTAPEALIAGDVVMQDSPEQTLFSAYDRVLGLPQATYVARGYAITANLSVPRAALDTLGGFDEGRFSGGDIAFCRAAGRAGFALVFAPMAQVTHPPRTRFADHFAKLQRVRGGQIASGPLRRRLFYLGRTALPPLRRTWAALTAPHPWGMRAQALLGLWIMWGAGFYETARLLLGGAPVR